MPMKLALLHGKAPVHPASPPPTWTGKSRFAGAVGERCKANGPHYSAPYNILTEWRLVSRLHAPKNYPWAAFIPTCPQAARRKAHIDYTNPMRSFFQRRIIRALALCSGFAVPVPSGNAQSYVPPFINGQPEGTTAGNVMIEVYEVP